MVHAYWEYLNFVTYGYTVLTVMNELELADKDLKPKNDHCKTDEQKTEYLDSVAMNIVTKLLLPNEEAPKRHYEHCQQETEKKKGRFQCGFKGCFRTFACD